MHPGSGSEETERSKEEFQLASEQDGKERNSNDSGNSFRGIQSMILPTPPYPILDSKGLNLKFG